MRIVCAVRAKLLFFFSDEICKFVTFSFLSSLSLLKVPNFYVKHQPKGNQKWRIARKGLMTFRNKVLIRWMSLRANIAHPVFTCKGKYSRNFKKLTAAVRKWNGNIRTVNQVVKLNKKNIYPTRHDCIRHGQGVVPLVCEDFLDAHSKPSHIHILQRKAVAEISSWSAGSKQFAMLLWIAADTPH